jgi:hypothetical protein
MGLAVTIRVVDELLPLEGHRVGGGGLPAAARGPAIAGGGEGREIGGKDGEASSTKSPPPTLVLWAFACSRSLSFYRRGLAVHRKLRKLSYRNALLGISV